jgi:heme-degrading monooxygenase HmoA
MIVRVFRARVRPGMDNEFERMVRELSIPLVDRQRGLIARYSGRPVGGNATEFTMVSIWEDLDALKAFAGEDWEQSVVPEEERAVLAETFVHHYELFAQRVAP